MSIIYDCLHRLPWFYWRRVLLLESPVIAGIIHDRRHRVFLLAIVRRRWHRPWSPVSCVVASRLIAGVALFLRTRVATVVACGRWHRAWSLASCVVGIVCDYWHRARLLASPCHRWNRPWLLPSLALCVVTDIVHGCYHGALLLSSSVVAGIVRCCWPHPSLLALPAIARYCWHRSWIDHSN